MSRNTIPLTQDIIDALTSLRSNNERIGNLQSNFLSARIANSSGLDVLQEYGARVPSPSWNDRNSASSVTPSNATSLNLNSVEEEDEYLYGDSNSVPEEQVSVEEVSILNNTGTEWSDEEDPYIETHGTIPNRLNSRLTKKTDCDYQNKTQETVNFPHIKRDENLIEGRTIEIPEQKYASHKLEYDGSILSPTIEENQFSEINPIKAKSKYHAAAEVLKKRAIDKANVINNNSNENLGTFPGSSKNISELSKSVDADWKTDKLAVKRQTPVLNKKHVDNIRDYLTAPPRKRPYPEEFVPEKYPRYETSRSSPSRYHSPPKSSSYKYSSSRKCSESDRMKYASSSRHRSPSFESEKHYSRYSESHRRYSRSPKRWSRSPDYRHRGRSREKSSDYSRHKDRSPRSRRSRSRSPGYYSSRKNAYDKKTLRKSPKKSDYSKKKEKSNYSSGDSFCSLSLDSSSDSSDSSDESSDEKRKSIKPASKDIRKHEDEVAKLKNSDDTHSKVPDSTLQSSDMSNKASNIFNAKEGKMDKELINSIWNAFKPNKEQQILMNFLEQMQPQQQPIVTSDSSTFASPSVANINIASNLQMPVIPSSESYAYPTMPGAPVQYVAPQMTNFSPIIPSAAFPAPVMAAALPPSEYGPYLPMPSVPQNDSQYITNIPKNVNARPSTLRTIPMSDAVHIPPVSSSNITVTPNEIPTSKWPERSKIEESKNKGRSKIQELNSKERSKTQESTNKERSKIQNFSKSTQPSLEKKISYSKGKGHEKSVNNSSPKLSESTSEQNRLLIIEKFKKMKADRAKAVYKAKSASDDVEEMRKMLDETFGKKISTSEKLLYTKCKNQFNLSLDIANQTDKEARRSDENLNSFKSKLPTALQAEVSKIKIEQCKDEPVTNEKISCLDQGDHICCDCYIYFNNIKEFLTHIQSPDHKEQMTASNQEWRKDFIKEQKQDANEEQKKTLLKAVKGTEFVKSLTGFYCTLCREVFLDELSTEQHLKGHQHYVSYESFISKKAPLYEIKRLFKRYMKMAISTRQKKAERRKAQDAAEIKAKEILLKEKSKEVKFEELEDKDSEEFSPSSHQKIGNIKLNLSEKDDDKSVEKKSSETKNSPKYIYIGKAPNYKKVPPQKPTPWYKRENILNKKELDASSSSPDVINEVEKVTKNTQSPEVKLSNPMKKSEMSDEDFVGLHRKISSSVCSKENSSQFESKNPDTQVVKKKSNVPDSSNYKHVKLSEIALPEVSSLPSSSNANIPQPMDIDNSQDVHSKPKSEEERDFLLLGINREDLQPLVVPVPPPTSMVSYPSLSTVRTLSSNINCGTTSTSSIEDTMKSFDFSKPPPSIASYQNNVPHIPVYGNQNNIQNVGSYSYSTNNPQMPVYSNTNQMNFQTTYQTIPPFSTPPPTVYRNNPPPMLPYSNANNMTPAHQYPSTNNASYNAYSNSIPANLNNQSYQQPSVFTMMNTLQNIVPPGSEYDSSFHNNYSAVAASSIYVKQNKTSPTLTSPSLTSSSLTSPSLTSPLKKKGNPNIITIVPENNDAKISANDNKPTKLQVTPKVKIQDKNKIPSNEQVNKGTKNIVKMKTEKTINITNSNKNTLKVSKVVGNIKANSSDTSDSSVKKDNSCFESEVKCVIDNCVKKIVLKESEDNDGKKSVKSSSVTYNNSVNSNGMLIKSQQMTISKVSNIVVDGNTNNESDLTSKKISEKQIPTKDVEINDDKIREKSSNIICTSTSSLNNLDKVDGGGENREVTVIGKVAEKTVVDSAHDGNIILKECTENATSNSILSKQEQINVNDDIVFIDEVPSIKVKKDSEETSTIHEKQMSVESLETGDGTNLEKSSNISSSLAGSLNKMEEVGEDGENTKVTVTVNIDEKCTVGSIHDPKVILKENVENTANDSVVSKQEQINANDDIVFVGEVSNIKIENKNDSGETSIKICEKQMSAENIEVDNTILEKSSNVIGSLADSSDKIEEEVGGDSENTKVIMAVSTNENITESKIIVTEDLEKTTNDSVFSKQEKVNVNDDIVFVDEVSNIKMENKNDSGETSIKICEKQMSAKSIEVDNTILEKSSNVIGSLADSSDKMEVDRENTKVIMTVNTNENIMVSNTYDRKIIVAEDIGKTTNDSGETSIKICEKHMSSESMEVDSTILEKSSNVIGSLADSSDKMEVDRDSENTKVIMTVSTNENIMESNTYDSKIIVTEGIEKTTNDSVFSKQEQINANDEIDDIVFLDEVSNIEIKNKIIKNDSERQMIREKVENTMNDSMFSKQQIDTNNENDIVFVGEVSNIKIENKKNSEEQMTKEEIESIEFQNATNNENDIAFVDELPNIKVKNYPGGEMTAESMEVEDNIEKSSNIICSFSENSNETDEAKIKDNTEAIVTVNENIKEKSVDDTKAILKEGTKNLINSNNDEIDEVTENTKVFTAVSETIFQKSTENKTNDSLFAKHVDIADDETNGSTVFKKSSVEYCFTAGNSSNTINEKGEDLELSSIMIEKENKSCSGKDIQDENDFIHVSPMSVNKTLEEAPYITDENKNDEKQIPVDSLGVDDDCATMKISSNNMCLSDKIDEITEDEKNTKIIKTTIDDSKVTFEQSVIGEFSFDKTTETNDKKDCDELEEENGKIASEKLTEFCLPVGNSCNTINSKNDEEMLNRSTIVEDGNIDDPCHDTNVLNENIKNYVTLSGSKEQVLEENKNVFQSSDVSNYTEINKLKYKEISHQDLKDDSNTLLKPTFNDQSLSVLSEVNEKEICGKKMLETELRELQASSDPNVQEENNLAVPETVKCESSSNLMENLEDSEVSTSDKVITENMNKSEDVFQDIHLKLNKNSEDQKFPDNKAKTASESDYQEVLEDKMEDKMDTDECVIEEKKETDECAMELSDISCTEPKDSSDTEEYEDEQ